MLGKGSEDILKIFYMTSKNSKGSENKFERSDEITKASWTFKRLWGDSKGSEQIFNVIKILKVLEIWSFWENSEGSERLGRDSERSENAKPSEDW